MVTSQPPGNNPSYYYRASPTLPQLLWMFPETPYVLYMQLQHQVIIEMVLLSIFLFYTNQIHGGIISRLFFIHFVAPCAVSSSGWKYYSNLSVLEDLSTLALHTSVGCISLQNAVRPHFVTQPILLSENIPNIWYKSSTKQGGRPDWNDKNDTAKIHAPSYHMEGFTNGSGCHF